jgi:cell division protease FtsH
MGKARMNAFTRNLALWVIIGLLVIALFNLFQNPSGRGPQANLAFSDFLAEVDNGRVRDVTIQGSTITGHFSDGRSFRTYAPEDPSLVSRLTERGVRITAVPADDSTMGSLLAAWFPSLLLAAVLLSAAQVIRSGLSAMAGSLKEAGDKLVPLVGRVEDLERRQTAVEQRLADLVSASQTSSTADRSHELP